MHTKTLLQDLLTENRYWTFWKSDWSERINIVWNGKTKWKSIVKQMVKKLGEDCGYERQVQLREPDVTFD